MMLATLVASASYSEPGLTEESLIHIQTHTMANENNLCLLIIVITMITVQQALETIC